MFVILVGTNNHHSTVEEIVDGLETIAWIIGEKRPQSKIVILVSVLKELESKENLLFARESKAVLKNREIIR